MKEVIIEDKQAYLNKNYPFSDVPKLSEKRRCIHCDKTFQISDYKVFIDKSGEEYICCPDAPECDGTVIDWFPAE